MTTLIFSQAAIFRMQQLASSYFHKTGVRHRISSDEGMLDLLKEAALCGEKEVRRCYDAFVMELNKRQIDGLAARGVKLRLPTQFTLATPIRQAG
jgi:hypothetical protein